ncbi:Pre-mRNA-splicing factor ATP-dependent RNA helicase prp22, partial [Stegodyphus mimosarum]
MLSIPVRYVIDCGIKKDFIFDSKKNLDVLTTSFNSRATARLRKGLAGTFCDGFCYRLYSKENYVKEMASREYPEMLSVSPFNSLLKLFQYFPKTWNSVQLIEPLPESIRNNALKDLIKYNVIREGNLTTLGKKITKLPYPTKYSKFILLGIHWGIAYEAVVLVSFFSVKGRVFQYSDDSDKQRRIDAVKLQLSHNDSDTLTYLYVFKTWIENDCSSSWCE